MIARHGGLDGVVTERGHNHSLGERQLLALTRALVADPPIVILDEATASVDRETERRLQRAQDELIAGRTAVLAMEAGHLVEQGSHAELIAKNGRYAALVELQRSQG